MQVDGGRERKEGSRHDGMTGVSGRHAQSGSDGGDGRTHRLIVRFTVTLRMLLSPGLTGMARLARRQLVRVAREGEGERGTVAAAAGTV